MTVCYAPKNTAAYLRRRVCALPCQLRAVLYLRGYLGGDAVNGKIAGGHYFLMSHGRYTEVSADIFNYSRSHAYSTGVTHPLAFAAGFWDWRIKCAAGAGF